MDVAVSAFRAQMKDHLARVRSGEAIVLTERGIPVAKVVAVDAGGMLEELARDGLLAAPDSATRPRAESTEPLTPRGAPPGGGLMRRLRRQG